MIKTAAVAVIYKGCEVMRKPVRSLSQMCTGIMACANLSVFDSMAQSYPSKPIRLISGFTAGSAPDTLARTLTPILSENLGQPVIVENRGGAGGSIATEMVARSPADGYTLLLLAAADTLQPALRANLPYDMERDLTPVSMVATSTAVLAIHPSVPASNVKELIALARLHPGKLNERDRAERQVDKIVRSKNRIAQPPRCGGLP